MYQERSLGVFPHEIGDDYADALENSADSNRVAIWGKYLMRHVQKQLTFGAYLLKCSATATDSVVRYVVVGALAVSPLCDRGKRPRPRRLSPP